MKLLDIWDRLVTLLLLFATVCFGISATITVVDVVSRWAFSQNVPAAIELATLFIALGALLSLPMCFSTRGHVTATMVSEFVPRTVIAILSWSGAILSLVFIVALLWMVVQDTANSFGSGRVLPDTGLRYDLALAVAGLAFGLSVIAAIRGLFWHRNPERLDG